MNIMPRTIILTTEEKQSYRLKERLKNLDSSFSSVPCITKKELNSNMDVEYIFSTWYMPHFTQEEVRQFFPKLKAIFYAAGTVKGFAEPFLKSGVRVFSSAMANGIPVAEYTASQIILANKGFQSVFKEYKWPIWKRGFWELRHKAECHFGNYGANVGIIGCGTIGTKVIELLKPYNLHVKIYDPYISQEKCDQLNVERVAVEELFATCNVISNHLPDIPETKRLIDRKLLSMMPEYATLINTGRGAQINEKDLASVFRKRKDLTAVLDVTTHEPIYPWSPLFWRKNVIITPHIAGSLSGEIDRMTDFSYRAYNDFIIGEQPEGEVYLDQLSTKA